VYRDDNGFLLADQNDKPFAAGDAHIETGLQSSAPAHVM
jgi:hypothetical protein